jgi:transcriptional regulator with XRE-family HTH domain
MTKVVEHTIDWLQIDTFRMRLGLSVAQFAKLLNTSRQSYYAWLKGRRTGSRIHADREAEVRTRIRLLIGASKVLNWPNPEMQLMKQDARFQRLSTILEDALEAGPLE